MRIAIVIFNLGGPGSLQEVPRFLFRLFNDPAIIRLPFPLRQCIAALITWRRTKTAQHIYAQMGGKSPILEQTLAQEAALEAACNRTSTQHITQVFTVMRYTAPRSAETVEKVKQFNPDRVILLPLYPQFSTTTSASSFLDWKRAAAAKKLHVPTQSICCYPLDTGWVKAQSDLILTQYQSMQKAHITPKILFSAHGLPEKIIAQGDPYAWQVLKGCEAIVAEMAIPGLDWELSFQSRVGPMKWIGPATEDVIRQAGKDNKSLLVVPIAFVSEHSETLVELDIEYRLLAKEHQVPHYERVAAVGVHPLFIESLAELCMKMAEEPFPEGHIVSSEKRRLCSEEHTACPCKP